jgi:predicted rRNA methylase YqxC with S4 and FtsJ domains
MDIEALAAEKLKQAVQKFEIDKLKRMILDTANASAGTDLNSSSSNIGNANL